jgi:NAD(P)H-flavin reductase
VILHFDRGAIPAIGTTRPISRRRFAGWHHFANVPGAPGGGGYRMLVSRAGDWTSALIDEPPTHVWVRGIPTVGVANVRRLFSRVVLVATGSGIGPVLGHLLDTSVPSRLVWVTKNPRLTYGDAFVDEIEAAQPNALIWDSSARGKPDVLQLARAAYLESGAEAVVCVSNRTVTWQVVHGLERCGIPAFGPIWDS